MKPVSCLAEKIRGRQIFRWGRLSQTENFYLIDVYKLLIVGSHFNGVDRKSALKLWFAGPKKAARRWEGLAAAESTLATEIRARHVVDAG
ncbi:hypothetical protein TIFTF001_009985 [Ficus carica]|uniref:Uncharacterized protein n=1 Tax=Ficus carica TaxID=3494 RepID=A0AA88A7W3_FICCA|nr:hypothetical protein TIFTF001_009985 [Ficus carica]